MTANPLERCCVFEKLEIFENLKAGEWKGWSIPDLPGREIEVRPPDQMPQRKGLSFADGQARLLHDLGSIELQAAELCLRTLIEYPESPVDFQADLLELLRGEAGHLRLCLEGLKELGFQWGSFPVHLGLWAAVRSGEPLLDRLLIVHRYLEGNGIDAGSTLLRRLAGVPVNVTHRVVDQIVREEVGHVKFGNVWYRSLCQAQGLDPEVDLFERFRRIEEQVPKRIDHLAWELRRKAGFTEPELNFFEERRKTWSLF